MSAVLTPGRAAALPDRPRDRAQADPQMTAIEVNRSWEVDRALMLERSERRAWWVAIAGLVLGLIGIAAVFVQGPLRRVVEIPIVVDRVTGEATVQQRLSVETIPPMEALDKHNLATFVRAREGYSWMFLQRDFDQVARMAVPAVFSDYNRQFEGDGSETLVNARMEDDLLVVDRVSRRLMLRAGSAVVGLWNEAFDIDGRPPGDGTTVPGVQRVLKADVSGSNAPSEARKGATP